MGDGFRTALEATAKRAAPSDIATFGITPTKPETGYGYLELTKGGNPQPLARFVEKPDAARAAEMIADGGYLWNAGIFLALAAALIAVYEAKRPKPSRYRAPPLFETAKTDLGFTGLDPAAWEELEDVSIDYAIMEKARNLVVMPYGGCWSDLGGWEAVWQASSPDADGTAASPGALAIDGRDTLLRSEAQGQRIVDIGLEYIVAIATPKDGPGIRMYTGGTGSPPG